MNKELLKSQQEWIRGELEACANFWLKNGWDKENGGVYTCLDRWGKIYSTDKSVWMQGRCAWTFSYHITPQIFPQELILLLNLRWDLL